MKRILTLAIGIPLIFCCTSWPTKAQDATADEDHFREFNNATLNDRYGFHVLALTLNPSDTTTGASYPFAISGYYQFHGDGTLDGKDTVSSGQSGTPEIIDRQYNGTYHVNPDGTGWLILNISPTFQPKGKFVITEDGKEIEIIFAVTGNLNAFTLHKQHLRVDRSENK